MTTQAQVPSSLDCSATVTNGLRLIGCEPKSAEFRPEHLVPGAGDHVAIPLCQRLLAAVIPEEDFSSGNDDLAFDADGVEFDIDAEMESNGLSYQSQDNFQFAGHAAFNGFRITGRPEYDEPEGTHKTISSNFSHSQNGFLSEQVSISGLACSESQYASMHINEKLLLEVNSIGIFPELEVGLLSIISLISLLSSVSFHKKLFPLKLCPFNISKLYILSFHNMDCY